jgi:hypothetical protein
MDLYGAENWTRGKVDQKHLGSFEMRYRWKTKKVSWTNRVRNQEEQKSQRGEKYRTYRVYPETPGLRRQRNTRLQINACENCPRPPSYVQLGTLTH